MKKIKNSVFLQSSNLSIIKISNIGQATVEYILFVLIMIIACSGALKVILIAWQYKFELISKFTGTLSVLFC